MSAAFPIFIQDQLSQSLEDIFCRRMFGGHGLYQQGTFFAIIHNGRLYFKTSSDTIGRYLDVGMQPFQPTPRQTLKNYYEVPVDVVENADRLCEWARQAIDVARKTATPKG